MITAEEARQKTKIAINHKKASVLVYVFKLIQEEIKKGKYYTVIPGIQLSETDIRKLTNFGYNVSQIESGIHISWSE